MIESIFIELSIIIIIAVVVSGIMKLLKQPIMIGYIITGIITGPYFLDIVKSMDSIRTFSQFGIAFLLFIAGLSLNPKIIRSVGKVSLLTGVGQVTFTSLIGFTIAKLLGFPTISAAYISIALSFSSTIIIIKLLSDKGRLETLYGRIALGFLIVQDIIAIVILMVISSFAKGTVTVSLTLESILIGAVALAVVVPFSIFVLPDLSKKIAKSQEFLLLFSIGWMVLLSAIFGYLGFSIEIGALIAGITLAVTPYHYEIKLKLKILRDFFILFFFVLLGSQMAFSNMTSMIIPIAIFSTLVLVGNPIIVMSIMGLSRYSKRNGFLAGLTVAQISEFSLILVSLGVSLNQLGNDVLSMITAIALITIFGSTYMIVNGEKLYQRVSKYLSIFERKGKKVEGHEHRRDGHYEIMLFGCNRIGYTLLDSIKKLKKKFMIIDYNPEIVSQLSEEGYHCIYGDANDTELLNSIDFSSAKMVISTIPEIETNLILIDTVRARNKKAVIIVVSHQIDEAMKLHESGATYVIMPYFLGGRYASTLIEKYGTNVKKFLKEKTLQIEHLKMRETLKHEHPRRQR